jgi:hypothetical protein
MSVTYEPFNGDVEQLEELAITAFRDEYGLDSFPNIYCQRYFDYLFGGMEERDHLVAAYEDGRLMSFAAFIPRRYHFQGDIYRGAMGCLLVTRKEAHRRGIAIGLAYSVFEANEAVKEQNYDLCVAYLEKGHRSSKMIAKLKAGGHPIHWLKSMYVIIRAIDLPKIFAAENVKWYERAAMRAIRLDKLSEDSPPGAVRDYKPSDLEQCLARFDEYKDTTTLARVFEPAELARELSYGDVSHTLVWDEGGDIRGLINWVIVDHVGKFTQPWAWINNVYLHGLDRAGQRELVRAFLLKVREQGAAGVVEWFKNYYPKRALWTNRFIPFPRGMDMIAWDFNHKLNLTGVSDVFEIMI